MIGIHDKRDRALRFRTRLGEAMALRGLSQAALARRTGVDRSTVSQLLAKGEARLPGAQLLAECAAALGVSADWLLGLSDHPETAADLLAAAHAVTEAARAPIDEQIFDWHVAAAGYKIRHVPATLPDMLKTEAFMDWEYAPHLGRSTDQAIGASRDRLNWMRQSGSDYEIAMPLHELSTMARAEGYYRALPAEIARGQIAQLAALHEQLYPRLRVTLFDARQVFSAPLTVFGAQLAVVYLGQHYLTYRDAPRVGDLSRHFDALVRAACVHDHAFPNHLAALAP